MTTPTLCWGLVKGDPPVGADSRCTSSELEVVGFWWKNPLRFLAHWDCTQNWDLESSAKNLSDLRLTVGLFIPAARSLKDKPLKIFLLSQKKRWLFSNFTRIKVNRNHATKFRLKFEFQTCFGWNYLNFPAFILSLLSGEWAAIWKTEMLQVASQTKATDSFCENGSK